MADFCTFCAKELKFPFPDIDIKKIFDNLDPGYVHSFMCEGCDRVGVVKTHSGGMLIRKEEYVDVDSLPRFDQNEM